MNIRSSLLFILINIFVFVFLIGFSQSVYATATECPKSYTFDLNACNADCQTTCKQDTPGYCCPKGCQGKPLCQPGQICIPNPLKVCTFEGLIDNVINFIFYVSLVLAPLMIIVAAIYLLSSAGDPGRIKTAKDIILYTAVGFIIVLLAKGLIAMLKQIIGG